ncbi:MAG TPA: hypothetical protein VGC76_11830 [Pyrinomonadaceae bacterium]|jgi:hypothetical protein
MKMRLYSAFKIACCLIFVLTFSSVFYQLPKAESSQGANNSFDLSNYDIRLDKTAQARESVSRFVEQSGKSFPSIDSDRKRAALSEEKMRSAKANLKIEHNEDLRIPEVLSPDYAQQTEFLTAPSSERRADVLKNFINQNAALFGLRGTQINQLEKTADYANPNGNLSFVQFEQKINSIPVFRGEIKAGFTRKNEIVRIINNLAPRLDYESLLTSGRSAEQAGS